MSPEEITLVQSSFRKVAPSRETAAQLFYARLFELDPRMRAKFRGDMNEQGRKLMSAIAFVVEGLDEPDSILDEVRALGRRHAGYGAEPRHYETVATALLWTLERSLGEDFTHETKEAWTAAYVLLSTTMIEAGAERAR